MATQKKKASKKATPAPSSVFDGQTVQTMPKVEVQPQTVAQEAVNRLERSTLSAAELREQHYQLALALEARVVESAHAWIGQESGAKLARAQFSDDAFGLVYHPDQVAKLLTGKDDKPRTFAEMADAWGVSETDVQSSMKHGLVRDEYRTASLPKEFVPVSVDPARKLASGIRGEKGTVLKTPQLVEDRIHGRVVLRERLIEFVKHRQNGLTEAEAAKKVLGKKDQPTDPVGDAMKRLAKLLQADGATGKAFADAASRHNIGGDNEFWSAAITRVKAAASRD